MVTKDEGLSKLNSWVGFLNILRLNHQELKDKGSNYMAEHILGNTWVLSNAEWFGGFLYG